MPQHTTHLSWLPEEASLLNECFSSDNDTLALIQAELDQVTAVSAQTTLWMGVIIAAFVLVVLVVAYLLLVAICRCSSMRQPIPSAPAL